MSDQTIEEAKEDLDDAIQAFAMWYGSNDYTGSTGDARRSDIRNAIELLISAVRQEAGAAALRVQSDGNSRTLADYRPQHDEECSSRRCSHCNGWLPNRISHGDCRCRVIWHNLPCTCGLDSLLAALRQSEPTGERAAFATRLEAIVESLATQEPRRDCIAAIQRLVNALRVVPRAQEWHMPMTFDPDKCGCDGPTRIDPACTIHNSPCGVAMNADSKFRYFCTYTKGHVGPHSLPPTHVPRAQQDQQEEKAIQDQARSVESGNLESLTNAATTEAVSDELKCPRCGSADLRRISELFGAGWRDYCNGCQNIFTRPTPVWSNIGSDVAETVPPLDSDAFIRLAELRRLQREIREWSVSQMIWPTMEETLTLIDQRCAHLQQIGGGNQLTQAERVAPTGRSEAHKENSSIPSLTSEGKDEQDPSVPGEG